VSCVYWLRTFDAFPLRCLASAPICRSMRRWWGKDVEKVVRLPEWEKARPSAANEGRRNAVTRAIILDEEPQIPFDIAVNTTLHAHEAPQHLHSTFKMSGVSQLSIATSSTALTATSSLPAPSTSTPPDARTPPSIDPYTDYRLQCGHPQQHHHVVHRLRRRIRHATVRRKRAGYTDGQDANLGRQSLRHWFREGLEHDKQGRT
jgi:hypothetical protein